MHNFRAPTITDGGDVLRIEERSGELVVAGCDSVVDLQVADHALDAVACAMERVVPADRYDAFEFLGDGRACAVSFQRFAMALAS